MTDLRGLQLTFQQYLLTGNGVIEQSIVNTTNVSSAKRLEIYRDAYQGRLVEAMASNFPCINTHLGCEGFHRICFAYIDALPSPFRSIRWFGNNFADYLSCHPYEEYPYLAEMAEFEWKMTLAFDAADSDTVKIEQMASIPPECWATLYFTSHASLQRMNFYWNTVSVWESIAHNRDFEPPVQSTISQPWILWRNNYTNRYYALSEQEAWAIDAIIKGATFSELCEGLCTWIDEQSVGMTAASFLKGWLQSGLIAAINY